MTEVLNSQVHFGRPFDFTWELNASLVPAIIHKQMAKPSATTAVLNKYLRILSCRLAMSQYGLSMLASVGLN